MSSGPQGVDLGPRDVLQVIPRRTPSGGPPDGGGTGSQRISLPPARRRKLTRIVFGALGACGVILVAAAIAHAVRPNDDATAFASTATAAAFPPSSPAVAAAPKAPPVAPAPAAPPAADVPQTGTLRLQRPAAAGKVWLDGQKIATAAATVSCGPHQLKIGAHGKAHAIDVPCGGELKVSR
jgi:hypothetical protein